MDTEYPLVLIDTSYIAIYRFFSVQKTFRMSKTKNDSSFDNPDYDWSSNDLFVKKYRELFFKSLLRGLKRLSIPLANVIFVMDDSSSNVWRNDFIDNYKATRKRKRQTGLKTILEMMREELLPGIERNHGVSHIKIARAEADDIIAVITKSVLKKQIFPQVLIISNDKDFVQLGDPKVVIINMQGMKLGPKHYKDPRQELLYHILCGDRSDNISPCIFHCTKAKVDKYIQNPERLSLLLQNAKIKSIFYRNQQLIDLDYIPHHIKLQALQKFYSILRPLQSKNLKKKISRRW